MAPTRSSQPLLQATVQLIAEGGIDSLTLSQVAARAGVSRATAYREFGDKDGLLAAVAQHEITEMIGHTLGRIDLRAAPSALVPAIVLRALGYLRQHAAFGYVRDHEPHWLLRAVLVVGESRMNLVQIVATMVASAIDQADQSRLALPPIQAAEIVVRTVLSHILIEQSALTDQQVADAVARAITA